MSVYTSQAATYKTFLDATPLLFQPCRSELSIDPCAADETPIKRTARNLTSKGAKPMTTKARLSTQAKKAPEAKLPTPEAPPEIEISCESSEDKM